MDSSQLDHQSTSLVVSSQLGHQGLHLWRHVVTGGCQTIVIDSNEQHHATSHCELPAGSRRGQGGGGSKHEACATAQGHQQHSCQPPAPAGPALPCNNTCHCNTQTRFTPMCQLLAPHMMQHVMSLSTLMTGKVHHVLSEFRRCGRSCNQSMRTKSLTWQCISRR